MNLAATIPAGDAIDPIWHAAVIGAGPAGSLAACELARRGLRTLLIERRAFPRYKVCGGCINRRAWSILDAAGLGHLRRELPSRMQHWLELAVAERCVRLPLPGVAAIARSDFDAALVNAAVDAGACFLPETEAKLLPRVPAHGHHNELPNAPQQSCESYRRLHLRDRDGCERVIAAAVVVAADGLSHPALQRCGEFRPRVHSRSNIGVGAMLPRVPTDYDDQTIYMAISPTGYAGLVRTGGGQWNAAASVRPGFLRDVGGPAKALETLFVEAGFAAIDGLHNADWSGTPPLTRMTWPPTSERVFLIGDAAAYVEPFTGEGITWALLSARLVVPLVCQTVRCWSPQLARKWQRIWSQSIRHSQRSCWMLSALIRSPLAMSLVIRFLSRFPRAARPIVNQLNAPAVEAAETVGNE
ncbi:MAG: menaquinone reductase [Gemmatales bacterium]|nr:MAG: menaquinone reductase [Gemmatales bacterium]